MLHVIYNVSLIANQITGSKVQPIVQERIDLGGRVTMVVHVPSTHEESITSQIANLQDVDRVRKPAVFTFSDIIHEQQQLHPQVTRSAHVE